MHLVTRTWCLRVMQAQIWPHQMWLKILRDLYPKIAGLNHSKMMCYQLRLETRMTCLNLKLLKDPQEDHLHPGVSREKVGRAERWKVYRNLAQVWNRGSQGRVAADDPFLSDVYVFFTWSNRMVILISDCFLNRHISLRRLMWHLWHPTAHFSGVSIIRRET